MGDENIISGIADDSTISIDELIDLYGKDVLRMCMMYLGDRTRAEDAFQDTFVKVYAKLADLTHVDSKKAWILRIAVNVCKDILKGFWWQKVMKGGNIDESQSYSSSESIAIDDLVMSKLENMERKKVVFECVRNLPQRFRDVVLMYYFQDCDTRQIANTLNLPEGTVRSRLFRSRKLLQESLKRWYECNETDRQN